MTYLIIWGSITQEDCHFPAEVMKASYPLHSDPGIGDPKMITDSDKKPIFDFYPRYFPLS